LPARLDLPGSSGTWSPFIPPIARWRLDSALLGLNRMAVLAKRPFLLEEPPGLRIAHPQRDELLTAQALEVEFDHRTALRLWPRNKIAAGAAWGGLAVARQE